eukprot:TRINITY_DN7334_c0_g2_i1.p1 TRINITY_DN7334_c0_g2~~TRINITY_DN7334_c0_g2_i1.p1  ORF type:complete len:836 (+),score=209.26 TRINITY_DN7334_c0_g2_i1:100-2508(+)
MAPNFHTAAQQLLPNSLVEHIDTLVESLSSNHQFIVKIATVLSSFGLESLIIHLVLQEDPSLTEAQVQEMLQDLQQLDVLTLEVKDDGRKVWQFAHEEHREVVHAHLLAQQKYELHSKCLDAVDKFAEEIPQAQGRMGIHAQAMFHNASLVNEIINLKYTVKGLQALLDGARVHLSTLNYDECQHLLDTALGYVNKHPIPDECGEYELEAKLAYLELMDQRGPGQMQRGNYQKMAQPNQLKAAGITRPHLIASLTELLEDAQDERLVMLKVSQAHEYMYKKQHAAALQCIEECLTESLPMEQSVALQSVAINVLAQMGETNAMLKRAEAVYKQWQLDGAPPCDSSVSSLDPVSYLTLMDGVFALSCGDVDEFEQRESTAMADAQNSGRYNLCYIAGLAAMARLLYMGCDPQGVESFSKFQRLVLSSHTSHPSLKRWVRLLKLHISAMISAEEGDHHLCAVCVDEMIELMEHESDGMLFALTLRGCALVGGGERLSELLTPVKRRYGHDWKCSHLDMWKSLQAILTADKPEESALQELDAALTNICLSSMDDGQVSEALYYSGLRARLSLAFNIDIAPAVSKAISKLIKTAPSVLRDSHLGQSVASLGSLLRTSKTTRPWAELILTPATGCDMESLELQATRARSRLSFALSSNVEDLVRSTSRARRWSSRGTLASFTTLNESDDEDSDALTSRKSSNSSGLALAALRRASVSSNGGTPPQRRRSSLCSNGGTPQQRRPLNPAPLQKVTSSSSRPSPLSQTHSSNGKLANGSRSSPSNGQPRARVASSRRNQFFEADEMSDDA